MKRTEMGLRGAQRRELCRDLREKQTAPETFFWELVRDRRFAGQKFRRQHPIGVFIVDFYCSSLKLVIELDGGVHHTRQQYDQERDTLLRSLNLHIVRIANEAFMADPAGVIERLETQFAKSE